MLKRNIAILIGVILLSGLFISTAGTNAWFIDSEDAQIQISANWHAISVIPGDYYTDGAFKLAVNVTSNNMTFPFNLGLINKNVQYPVDIELIFSDFVRADGNVANRPPVIESMVEWNQDSNTADFLIRVTSMHHNPNQTPKTKYGGTVTINIFGYPPLVYDIEVDVE